MSDDDIEWTFDNDGLPATVHFMASLTAEAWDADHDPNDYEVSRAAPLCSPCFIKRRITPEGTLQPPVRITTPPAEVCVDCGGATRSGIYMYMRVDEQTYKHWKPKELR